MSFQAITTFFNQATQDSELSGAVQSALEGRPAAAAFEIVDIAKAHGCDFTATELREYLAAGSGDMELSEEHLGAIAGGLLSIRTLDFAGLRKIRTLSLSQLRARRSGRYPG